MTDPAADLATRHGLETALSIPPADCTNSCSHGPCNCSGEFRVRAYTRDSVEAALDHVEAELARLTRENDACEREIDEMDSRRALEWERAVAAERALAETREALEQIANLPAVPMADGAVWTTAQYIARGALAATQEEVLPAAPMAAAYPEDAPQEPQP